jgi:hypothetical protein
VANASKPMYCPDLFMICIRLIAGQTSRLPFTIKRMTARRISFD